MTILLDALTLWRLVTKCRGFDENESSTMARVSIHSQRRLQRGKHRRFVFFGRNDQLAQLKAKLIPSNCWMMALSPSQTMTSALTFSVALTPMRQEMSMGRGFSILKQFSMMELPLFFNAFARCPDAVDYLDVYVSKLTLLPTNFTFRFEDGQILFQIMTNVNYLRLY